MTVDTIVIIGAGMTGGNAAVTLRGEGFRGRIVLIGDEPAVPYGRPPLSKTYLRNEGGLDDWLVKDADWYASNDVELLTSTTARSVDTHERQVTLASGDPIRYDRLLLCTGGRPRRPDIAGIDLPGVHMLRTIADCDSIKRAARPGMRAVIVGMGFIGSEVAASLTQLGLTVTAVMSGNAPLTNVLGDEMGAAMAAIHREHGVELIANDRVVSFEGSTSVERAITTAGARIDCDLVVIGAGIEPNLDVISQTTIALDNGILVDARCQTNFEGIYAAGDVANHLHPLFGRVRVEHYNNAEKMGRFAARAMLGDERPYDYVHTFWSDQFEHSLEYVGHTARWDRVPIRGDVAERKFLAFYVEGGTLRAVAGLNRGGDPELDEGSELHACQQLIAKRAAPSIEALTDERVDLRELAAAT
jgi:3-phenylpropionate/trans-cinnamate dioxygenase ferredoxin reductase component